MLKRRFSLARATHWIIQASDDGLHLELEKKEQLGIEYIAIH